jgi:glyoxylate/hydroxypyruvate reductase
MCGPSISHPNLTIGFLGFGRISECVVDRLLAFTSKAAPPKIRYVSSRARPDQAAIDSAFSTRWGVDVARAEKDDVAAQADIVIVLCSLSPATTDLVNKDFLRRMKKTAVLVNAARVSKDTARGMGYAIRDTLLAPRSSLLAPRSSLLMPILLPIISQLTPQGPIVNSADLAWALDNDEIFAAGLDVITDEPRIAPDHPLVQHPKCAVIPHMGSADYDTRNAMADLCVRNAIAGARGEALIAEVKV